ncbi:MAG: glycosyltransferase family 2 protein [Acidobacteriota bacterium]|nr:MAG: glycosyltransferase family 2 protein [Acidobacteriota bacterium]
MPPIETSVLILTWNSRELVGDAIASALGQSVGPIEVLVLDNASGDGTPEQVAHRFGQQVRLVCLTENLGYTGGYNIGLQLAAGQFLLLLNPDARLEPDFLEHALPAFDDPRVGIVSGCALREDRRTVDSSGQFLARSRKTIDRGYGRPFDPRRDRAGPVLSACGAAALYRREMVDDIADEGAFFDRDYFALHEDLEVGWRAWRAGWAALAVPQARAVHLRAGGAVGQAGRLAFRRSPTVLAHIVKNRWMAMIRHDAVGSLIVDLPFIVARDAALWSVLLLRRGDAVRHLWRLRAAYRSSWIKRRADRHREGRWGRWRTDTPQRGVWSAPGTSTSIAPRHDLA